MHSSFFENRVQRWSPPWTCSPHNTAVIHEHAAASERLPFLFIRHLGLCGPVRESVVPVDEREQRQHRRNGGVVTEQEGQAFVEGIFGWLWSQPLLRRLQWRLRLAR